MILPVEITHLKFSLTRKLDVKVIRYQGHSEFARDPEKIGLENNLPAREIAELAGIMPEELNFFAESLFWKRLREVKKIFAADEAGPESGIRPSFS
jgi:hypothetical protein